MTAFGHGIRSKECRGTALRIRAIAFMPTLFRSIFGVRPSFSWRTSTTTVERELFRLFRSVTQDRPVLGRRVCQRPGTLRLLISFSIAERFGWFLRARDRA